jgi:hypothetical protein
VQANNMRTMTSFGVVATYVSLAALMIWMASPAAASPAAGGGGSTVTVDGSTVTITVHIDFCCVQGASERDVWTPLVQAYVKVAQDLWNQALAQLPAKGCYDLQVVFDAHLLNKGDAWESGYHEITMNFGQRGISYSDDFWAVSQTSDDNTAYISTLTGTFFVSAMSSLTYAHEIGHLMGLGDDYTQDGCLVGRRGTLMCSQPGTIDQQLADRLVDILNEDGSLPQCWKGTLKGHIQGGTQNASTTLSFKFVVASNGGVKGKGTAKLTSSPNTWTYTNYSCTSLITPTPNEFDVDIGGRRDGDQFNLKVSTAIKVAQLYTQYACTSNVSATTHTIASAPPLAFYGLARFTRPVVRAEDGATNSLNLISPSSYGPLEENASIEVHRADSPTPRNMKNDNGRKLQYLQ